MTVRPRLKFFAQAALPRSSTLAALSVLAVLALLTTAAVLLGREPEPAGRTVVTVRLWDQQVAQAYRRSFDEFTRRRPDVEVRVNVVSYANYFDALRADVAGGSADDIFWINNAYFAPYADSGRLIGVTPRADWEPSVVEQFTRNRTLWGVPQLTDAGIALYYNADLLAAADVDPSELNSLRWYPDDDQDTFRPMLSRLTPGDGRRWAYNAGNDLQGIYLNYIGSAGGVFSVGDRFAFDNSQAERAFRYLVRLINVDEVAPPASDTNDNGDFSRNMFLQGRLALFQSGTYNLAQIAANAPFRWGVALMPAGPTGRVSVTNGIVAAGNSATPHPDATRAVLTWLGSPDANSYLGAEGAAVPAVLPAQHTYFHYWAARGVDVAPFFDVLQGPRTPAPGGAGFAAGFDALQPYFDEMFLGRLDVAQALAQAQSAANAAAER